MSSSQRVIQNQDGLELLQQLVNLTKDPKSITAVAELARKEAQLTQDQVDKLVEAKSFIANYDKLSKDFNDKTSLATNDLINQRIKLDQDIYDFNELKDSESIRLKELENSLILRESKISESEKSHVYMVSSFDSYKSSTEENHKMVQDSLDKQKSLNDRIAISNQTESKRLDEYKKSLQEKAQKISQLSAEFDDE